MLNLITLFILNFLLYGCLQPSIQEIDKSKNTNNNMVTLNNNGSITFIGANNATNITDNSVKINWNHRNGIDTYLVIRYHSVTSNDYTVVGAVNAPINQFSVKNLTIGQAYKFSVIGNSNAFNVDNQLHPVITSTLTSPLAPSSLEKISPQENIGQINQLQIRVYGTKLGDTVYLYTDNTCSSSFIGNSAAPDGEFTDINTSILPLGTYSIYANVKNAANNYSNCSNNFISYTVSDCPYNYVKVTANPSLGTNDDFCVSKYEMKCVGDSTGLNCNSQTAISQATAKPWANLTQNEAKNACTNLGANYHLITNSEWMTLAREIELKSTNWSNQQVSTSQKLSRGHSFNLPDQVVEAYPTDEFPCYNMLVDNVTNVANVDCTASVWHEKRRTYFTSSNEVIWDLSGNVWEWVDYENSNDKPTPANTWSELQDINSSTSFTSADFMPSNSSLIAVLNNIGIGYANSNGSTGVMKRGGNFDHGIAAGIYAFTMKDNSSTKNSLIGFRCVFLP
jgi:formylglycine-generating enzyme required for sulfatase activity